MRTSLIVGLGLFFACCSAAAALLPPSLTPAGGLVHAPALVVVTNPNPTGAVFCTVDGADPRNYFGNVTTNARNCSVALSVNRSLIIRTRVKSGTNWSDLVAAAFTADQDFSKLLFTEVMYHPTDSQHLEEEEFVEWKNVGERPLDLSGLHFRDLAGQSPPFAFPPFFTFSPNSIVQPGDFLLLAFDTNVFQMVYPGVPVHDEFAYRGAGLNERSGQLALVASNGAIATVMRYWTHNPWPVLPDNHGYFTNDVPPVGFSLVRTTLDPAADPEDFRTWRASTQRLGSPGVDDPEPIVPPVFVNELLTRSSGSLQDTVELYNPNSTNVHLGGWWLSDERNHPYRYQIPPGTMIPALGFVILAESDFNTGTNSLSFSSDGERCYLFSGDINGNLTGYSHGFVFQGSDRNVSFGRNRSSTGADFWLPEISRTFGATNSGPQTPALMITEVMYQADAPDGQFIELRNTLAAPLNLWDPQDPEVSWRIGNILPYGDLGSSERIFIFPANTTVSAGGYVLLVSTDPELFRSAYGIPDHVTILRLPESFGLSDTAGTLRVHRPSGTRDVGGPRFVVIEEIEYKDQGPWDPGAAGGGQSLERIKFSGGENDPLSWRASPYGSSPGRDNSGNLEPAVSAGGSRLAFQDYPTIIQGEISDDSWPGAVLTSSWSQISGPASVQFQSNTLTCATVTFPETGRYVLRFAGSDGVQTNADDTTIDVITRPFDSWRGTNFTAAELADDLISGPAADPDDDGATNVEEYFFGTAPKLFDSRLPFGEAGNDSFQVTWRQRIYCPDITIRIERADRVSGPWFGGPGLFADDLAAGGTGVEFGSVAFRSLLPLSNATQQFIRLKLSLVE